MDSQGPRVVKFIEQFLTLGGSFYGQPFEVLDFQREVIDDIYKLDEDGRRVHRTYLLGLPRKNGKTLLAAALGVYHLIADDSDLAPVVIAAAGDRQQARLVFDEVRRMILANDDLSSVCQVFRNEIRCSRNGGTFRVVSADAGAQMGLNPSCVIVDEVHVHRNNELIDALTLGSATRNQPLTLMISTAGFDMESPLGKLYRYGRQCQTGEVDDPTFGMTWYGPSDTDDFDPNDPEVWAAHNPAWGAFMNQAEFESAHRRTAQAPFIRFRLNGWTKTENSWLSAGVFEKLTTDRRLAPGEKIVLGFDGAWQSDSTALVACTVDEPRHLEILGLWEKPMDVAGQAWRTPVAEVRDAMIAAFERFTVVELAADPWRWESQLQDLADLGYPIIEWPTNSVARMTKASQAMYDAIIDERISHDGNPSLIRHFQNAILREDSRGARITKDRRGSTKKIDACIASIIAHHRAVVWREDDITEPQLLVF